jgi:dihydrodipicolinate reductase
VSRVVVVGALGRMGERVRAALAEHPELSLGAALEAPGPPHWRSTPSSAWAQRSRPRGTPTSASISVAA